MPFLRPFRNGSSCISNIKFWTEAPLYGRCLKLCFLCSTKYNRSSPFKQKNTSKRYHEDIPFNLLNQPFSCSFFIFPPFSPFAFTPSGLSLKRSQRIYRIAKLSREGWFATALRTTGGATLLRVHRLCHVHGELGDETDLLGCTSSPLDSLVSIEGQRDALLGNSANIFYVW